jgi:hypothetical protein
MFKYDNIHNIMLVNIILLLYNSVYIIALKYDSVPNIIHINVIF